MAPTRRTRRRQQRVQAKRPSRQSVPIAKRLGLLVLGVLMIAAGITLVAAGGSGSAERLGRIAGILIVIGIVVVVIALLGYR
ncbi:MAG: hypothetical protein ACR2GA_00905 [Chloroflexota bacterium]